MVNSFQSFSFEHAVMLLALSIFTIGIIWVGRRSDPVRKLNLAIMMAGLSLSAEIIETVVLSSQGLYDYHTDLPLFLCDITAIFLPFVLFRQSRKWIGILYFWAMAGTLQALITPELEKGFPSFEFFRYFLMHGCIVAAVLYTIIVFRIRVHWRDFLNAVLYAQAYLIVIHFINQILQSNYSYTLHKPVDPTLLDYFGPWPWYILWGEGLMVLLYLLLILPFVLRKSSDPGREPESFGTV